ncbi:MAG: S66 family peptidase [Wohlfahrtiimonas sp.]
MTILFPKPLQNQDLIGTTAPSSGIEPALHPKLNLAINVLQQRGYRVLEGNCLRTEYKNVSDHKQNRANELISFLTDPEIKAILPPRGGELAMEILELINFELLAQSNPKWISGFSDISTILLPLTLLSGWATLHGPNLMQFNADPSDSSVINLWKILESSQDQSITQYSSLKHQSNSFSTDDWEPTQWKRLDGKTTPAEFKGRLIGGCLDSISRLAGTKFGDIPKFCQQHANDGVILYFENVEMTPCQMARALLQLRMLHWFDNLSGLLIGRNTMPRIEDDSLLSDIDALQAVLGELSIPILYDVDIGHVPPQMSLMNGALAEVKFTDHSSSITQFYA